MSTENQVPTQVQTQARDQVPNQLLITDATDEQQEDTHGWIFELPDTFTWALEEYDVENNIAMFYCLDSREKLVNFLLTNIFHVQEPTFKSGTHWINERHGKLYHHWMSEDYGDSHLLFDPKDSQDKPITLDGLREWLMTTDKPSLVTGWADRSQVVYSIFSPTTLQQ